MAEQQDVATNPPVTQSGFYTDSTGRYRYHWWHQGQLRAGRHTFATLGLARLVQAVEQLGDLNAPHYLHVLGYTQAEIEAAVAAGELTWLPDGRVNPVHGTH